MNLRLDRSLEGSLAARAAGRVLVIDAYRNWNCGTWIGDLTARFGAEPPDGGFVEAEPVEGVRVLVRPNLTRLLDTAGASIHRGGLFGRGGLRVQLDRPELWISWLERPDAFGVAPADPSPAS